MSLKVEFTLNKLLSNFYFVDVLDDLFIVLQLCERKDFLERIESWCEEKKRELAEGKHD